MSRKSHTVVTFAVKLTLPLGSNTAQAQQYLRNAIQSYAGGGHTDDPFFGIQPDWFTVALTKKEITYHVSLR